MNDADQVLVEQMRLACDTARQLIEGGEYPKLELSRVRRNTVNLVSGGVGIVAVCLGLVS